MTSQIGVESPLMKPILEVRGLKKYFPIKKGFLGRNVGAVKAVDDVSFDIYPRETLGVVGESGCGKSTMGRTVLRLLEPTAGTVKFEGQNIFTMPKRELRAARRHMQIIFQDPYSSLNPRMTVGALIGDALELHGIAQGQDRIERARDLLERVGLQASYVNRYPHEFSGGQRQRIGIARAVALNPKFVVCDEAVSALDVSVQAQVLNLLQDLQDEYELSYMFIAHDLAVVRHIADRIAVMYLGRIVEMSTCDDLFENPLHPYTQALLSAIPIAKPGHNKQRVILQGDVPNPINPPAGCHFHTRCPLVFDRCRVESPDIKTVRDGHRVSCHLYENADWPATPFSILRDYSAPTEDSTADDLEMEEVITDVDISIEQMDELFDGSDDGDPRPVGIPEVLKGVAGMELGPFGELVDPEDIFTRTSEVPLLERIDSTRTLAPEDGDSGNTDHRAPTTLDSEPNAPTDKVVIADTHWTETQPSIEFAERTGKTPPVHDDLGLLDEVTLSLDETEPDPSPLDEAQPRPAPSEGQERVTFAPIDEDETGD